MRVLQMIPDIGISNGVMSVILNYAKAMPENIIFDVVYFQEKPENKQSEIESLGGRVFKINAPSPKSLLSNKELDNLFASHRGEWSALHIHCPHFTAFIAPYAKKYGIKKICTHCHTSQYSLTAANESRNKLLFRLGRGMADKYFACSREAGEFWYQSNFEVLNNAIDCKAFTYSEERQAEAKRALGIENKLAVGHIGRTDVVQKNHPFIIDVFGELKKLNENAVLLLVGAEPTDELSRKIKEFNMESSVMFLGLRNDIPQLLQAMDLFLFPSISEGLPVSLIEAQAAGLPVFMSDSITKEAVAADNVTAVSLDKSPSEWARMINEASLERKDNFNLLKELGWDIFDSAAKLADYYLN